MLVSPLFSAVNIYPQFWSNLIVTVKLSLVVTLHQLLYLLIVVVYATVSNHWLMTNVPW